MASIQYSYAFNNLSGLKSDTIDQTQNNIQNLKYGNYLVTNNFSENNSQGQVDFACQQPGFVMRNHGPAPFVIDNESEVRFGERDSLRTVEKLQLFQRPFLTIPYLGRGGGDPTVEFQLFQGEQFDKRKSISTIADANYMDYSQYPLHPEIKAYISDPAHSVEEAALDGWTRGGASARENGQTLARPTMRF